MNILIISVLSIGLIILFRLYRHEKARRKDREEALRILDAASKQYYVTGACFVLGVLQCKTFYTLHPYYIENKKQWGMIWNKLHDTRLKEHVEALIKNEIGVLHALLRVASKERVISEINLRKRLVYDFVVQELSANAQSQQALLEKIETLEFRPVAV